MTGNPSSIEMTGHPGGFEMTGNPSSTEMTGHLGGFEVGRHPGEINTMASNAASPEAECTCPVCCDIFMDPVVLLCGHSFCKRCLQEWWRQSGLQTCPMCKEIFPMAQPPRNLALKNLSDTLRRERTQRANSWCKEICSLHNERLKLFCQEDQQLVCVICRDAKKHKKHNCVPVNEAADSQRIQVRFELMRLRSKLESFKREKLTCDKMACHIKLQAQKTEKTIRQEFQKLYQFLRAEEAARIDAVRKEATIKSEAMNIRTVNLSGEISSLKDKIQTIQGEMKAEDISFMLNIKSTMERFQCNLPEPKTLSGALIDEAKHIGNLLFTVWRKMKSIVQYTPVTLDPNTGHSLVTISENMTSSTYHGKCQPLPDNPERLRGSEALGSEGFRSGKHSWDVEVGGYWAVGVAIKTKNQRLDPRKVWAIYMCVCTDILRELTPSDYVKVVSEDSFPQKVRVQLDYDQGVLSFFDLDRKTLVHTIKHTFTETVFPYFKWNAKICPSDLSVRIRQPT
ncbi:zinc-binding protein A33-like [Pempheris klunzingeri]|uniref:zinc-binding protein A33-like n=1 Tax=Pempheris klunzingeri TaxID=3127111 RepID=UPI003980D107